MVKIKLTNINAFQSLLNALKDDIEIAVEFENESIPLSFPCIAVHYYSDDTDFGSSYQIAFVYQSDFNS